ncbi:hypothetical protein C0Q70_17190 [Pomacea canaliculata]|uniref:G-protein coupled receptors family 1 profile domain-containing protein n=1 Tax=Pomacea canaliculata TaxID=400727 RepID=A0A2T7NRV4_POMCA|nr:hypothetical protein C0Q70_17190 [Pomacea canaliculata]
MTSPDLIYEIELANDSYLTNTRAPSDDYNCVCAVFLLASVGNIFVLLVILLDPRMRKSAANFFLVNLAISDLLVAVFCIPITVAEYVNHFWVFGNSMCKGTGYLQGISIVASVLTIVCMAFDRYFAIRHPMKNRQIFTVRRVKQLILVTWFLAAILVIPILVVRKVESHDFGVNSAYQLGMTMSDLSVQYCTEAWPSDFSRQVYGVVFLGLVYVIPGTLTVFLYMRTGTTLWAKDQTLTRQNSFITNEGKLVLTRRRLALMMIIISLLFAVCWLPYYIINICLDFSPLMSKHLIPLYPFTVLLGHSNSAQNPVLYCLMHRAFQQALLRLLRCQCKTVSRSNNNTQFCKTSVGPLLTQKFAGWDCGDDDGDKQRMVTDAAIVVAGWEEYFVVSKLVN